MEIEPAPSAKIDPDENSPGEREGEDCRPGQEPRVQDSEDRMDLVNTPQELAPKPPEAELSSATRARMMQQKKLLELTSSSPYGNIAKLKRGVNKVKWVLKLEEKTKKSEKAHVAAVDENGELQTVELVTTETPRNTGENGIDKFPGVGLDLPQEMLLTRSPVSTPNDGQRRKPLKSPGTETSVQHETAQPVRTPEPPDSAARQRSKGSFLQRRGVRKPSDAASNLGTVLRSQQNSLPALQQKVEAEVVQRYGTRSLFKQYSRLEDGTGELGGAPTMKLENFFTMLAHLEIVPTVLSQSEAEAVVSRCLAHQFAVELGHRATDSREGKPATGGSGGGGVGGGEGGGGRKDSEGEWATALADDDDGKDTSARQEEHAEAGGEGGKVQEAEVSRGSQVQPSPQRLSLHTVCYEEFEACVRAVGAGVAESLSLRVKSHIKQLEERRLSPEPASPSSHRDASFRTATTPRLAPSPPTSLGSQFNSGKRTVPSPPGRSSSVHQLALPPLFSELACTKELAGSYPSASRKPPPFLKKDYSRMFLPENKHSQSTSSLFPAVEIPKANKTARDLLQHADHYFTLRSRRLQNYGEDDPKARQAKAREEAVMNVERERERYQKRIASTKESTRLMQSLAKEHCTSAEDLQGLSGHLNDTIRTQFGKRFGAVKADAYELQATLDTLAHEQAFEEIKKVVRGKFTRHDERIYSAEWSPAREGHRYFNETAVNFAESEERRKQKSTSHERAIQANPDLARKRRGSSAAVVLLQEAIKSQDITYEQLLHAAAPAGSRFVRLSHESSVVDLTLSDLDGLPEKEYGEKSRKLVLVVAVGEDVRILPLPPPSNKDGARGRQTEEVQVGNVTAQISRVESFKGSTGTTPHTLSRGASTRSTTALLPQPTTTTISLRFVFDGVLAEIPLYIGLHRPLSEEQMELRRTPTRAARRSPTGTPGPGGGRRGGENVTWAMLGMDSYEGSTYVVSGQSTCVAAMHVQLHELTRGTTHKATLSFGKGVPAVHHRDIVQQPRVTSQSQTMSPHGSMKLGSDIEKVETWKSLAEPEAPPACVVVEEPASAGEGGKRLTFRTRLSSLVTDKDGEGEAAADGEGDGQGETKTEAEVEAIVKGAEDGSADGGKEETAREEGEQAEAEVMQQRMSPEVEGVGFELYDDHREALHTPMTKITRDVSDSPLSQSRLNTGASGKRPAALKEETEEEKQKREREEQEQAEDAQHRHRAAMSIQARARGMSARALADNVREDKVKEEKRKEEEERNRQFQLLRTQSLSKRGFAGGGIEERKVKYLQAVMRRAMVTKQDAIAEAEERQRRQREAEEEEERKRQEKKEEKAAEKRRLKLEAIKSKYVNGGLESKKSEVLQSYVRRLLARVSAARREAAAVQIQAMARGMSGRAAVAKKKMEEVKRRSEELLPSYAESEGEEEEEEEEEEKKVVDATDDATVKVEEPRGMSAGAGAGGAEGEEQTVEGAQGGVVGDEGGGDQSEVVKQLEAQYGKRATTAALNVQRNVRGWTVRRRNRSREAESYKSAFSWFGDKEKGMGLLLQRAWRGFVGRRLFRRRKQRVEAERAASLRHYTQEHIRMVIKIQAWQRGNLVRKARRGPLKAESNWRQRKNAEALIATVMQGEETPMNIKVSVKVASSLLGGCGHPLSVTEGEPCFNVPSCGIKVTRHGVVAMGNDPDSRRLAGVCFPYALSAMRDGPKLARVLRKAAEIHGEEIDRVVQCYEEKGTHQYDPAADGEVYLDIPCAADNLDKMVDASKVQDAKRVYHVRRFALIHPEHRNLLVNALNAQVRLAETEERGRSGSTGVWSRQVRNCYLEEGKGGTPLSAVMITEGRKHEIPLSTIIAKTGAIPEAILGAILVQVVAIVHRLHTACRCIHNDLDARNLYLEPTSGTITLAGFLFSQFPSFQPGADLHSRTGKVSPASYRRFLGPLRHQAPERILGLECSFTSDVWSIGFLARELAMGASPFSLKLVRSPFAYKTMVVEDRLNPLLVDPVEEKARELQKSGKKPVYGRGAVLAAPLDEGAPGEAVADVGRTSSAERTGQPFGRAPSSESEEGSPKVRGGMSKEERRAAREAAKHAKPPPRNKGFTALKKHFTAEAESKSARADNQRRADSEKEWVTRWYGQCSNFKKTPAPPHFTHDLSELIASCMDKNPENRPSTAHLIHHPFIRRCRGLQGELKAFLRFHSSKLVGLMEQIPDD